MDTKSQVIDALMYTRATFQGQWARWGIFVLCCLPSLLGIVLCDLFCAGLPAYILSWVVAPLLYVVLMGYVARIYRGPTTPPVFDTWGSLFVDGIRITVTYLLWFLPALLSFLALAGLTVALCVADQIDLFLVLLYFVITLLLIVTLAVAVLFSDFGAIRCARTNSILDGLCISSLTKTIKAIGWLNYLLALIVLIVPYFVVVVALSIVLGPVPYGFDIIDVCIITPFYLVFAARYMTLLYDKGTAQLLPTL